MLRTADSLEAWVSAPPVDGQANEALRDLIADALGVRASTVSLVSGATHRHKIFQVDQLTEAELANRVSLLAEHVQ